MTFYSNIPGGISKSPRNYVRQSALSEYNGNAKVGELIIDMADPAVPVYYVGNVTGNVIGIGTGNLSNYSANNGVIGNATTSNLIISNTVDFISASNVAFGDIANIHITGGSNGQVLTTDGAGNISWTYKVEIGDVKYSARTSDSNGWFKMDGRSIASLGLTPTQSAAAASIGFASTLPNATDRVLKQKAAPVNTVGGNNNVTIAVTNLPAGLPVTTDTAVDHDHQFQERSDRLGGYVLAPTNPYDPLAIDIFKGPGLPWTIDSATWIFSTFYFDFAGSHQHTVSLNGSDSPFNVENDYLVVNTFVFLGS